MTAYWVQVVHLRDDYSVDRQIFAHTAHLPEGTRVRVIVGKIPAWSVIHTDWYREDLVWQFETDHPSVLMSWYELTNKLGEKCPS